MSLVPHLTKTSCTFSLFNIILNDQNQKYRNRSRVFLCRSETLSREREDMSEDLIYHCVRLLLRSCRKPFSFLQIITLVKNWNNETKDLMKFEFTMIKRNFASSCECRYENPKANFLLSARKGSKKKRCWKHEAIRWRSNRRESEMR